MSRFLFFWLLMFGCFLKFFRITNVWPEITTTNSFLKSTMFWNIKVHPDYEPFSGLFTFGQKLERPPQCPNAQFFEYQPSSGSLTKSYRTFFANPALLRKVLISPKKAGVGWALPRVPQVQDTLRFPRSGTASGSKQQKANRDILHMLHAHLAWTSCMQIL